MKVSIRVKAGSKRESVEEIGPGQFKVHVKEAPLEGRANEAVIRVLASHFSVPKSRVRILHGKLGKNKVAEIDV